MILNNNKKFVHIAIPRTATTSINYVLENRKHPEPNLHHMGIKEVLELHPEATKYFKFTFVRNPFARLVSTYFEFTKNRVHRYSEKVYYEQPLLSEFNISDDETINFNNFCVHFPQTHWTQDIFFLPQTAFTTVKEANVMDFVGKVENMDEDWKHLCEILNLEPTVLPSNRPREPRGFMRSSEHLPYQEYYSEKTKEIVYNFYKEDFIVFDYE